MNNSRGKTTRGGPPDWGLGVGLTTPHNKRLRNINMSFGLRQVPWINDISDGIRTLGLGHGMLEVCIGQVH
jgi:hypothetical protein